MARKKKQVLTLDFGENGGVIKISEPQKLQEWFDKEVASWSWLNQIPQVQGSLNVFNNVRNQIIQFVAQWQAVLEQPEELSAKNVEIKNFLEQQFQSVILSSSEEGRFILQLNEDKGPMLAAGALLGLGGSFTAVNQPMHPKLIEGMVRGFLFNHKIDWSDEKNKLTQLQKENHSLIDTYLSELESHKKALSFLHKKQGEDFDALIEEHKTNLEAIEQAYDQKLALRKPVEYWDQRRSQHKRASFWYAIAAGVAGCTLFGILGWVAYELFLNLQPNEHPKPWQIGVFAVAAFFSIWMERILVRLFMSNMHLKADAEERKTMLQTYLAIIREGSEFAPEEKKLILERLFLPASDGLVRDDAAPPMLLELLSRK